MRKLIISSVFVLSVLSNLIMGTYIYKYKVPSAVANLIIAQQNHIEALATENRIIRAASDGLIRIAKVAVADLEKLKAEKEIDNAR